MTQQELIDHNVRLTLGDLMVQIVILKARITELEEQAMESNRIAEALNTAKPNGIHAESRAD